uniref:ROK family protein n=1 Tax=Oleomonas cavernae TaxID=2320859 RepID=UPI0018F49729|nr:ROK family protein [Oleomonas cavernae]
MGLRYGIDLGGTKTEILALDADGAERLRQRAPTPRGDYQAIVQHLARMVHAADAALGRAGTVGIGIPGALSPLSGTVKHANTTELNGHDFNGDLAAAIGRPVRLANDADCFALSEATDGAGAGARSVFGAILGTGTGGGIVVNGQLLAGPNALAGEWGHIPLPWPRDDERPGLPCYCGKSGCLETFISGTGFASDHNRTNGTALKGPEIVAAALAGEAAAVASLERYVDRLARALAVIINVIDPHVIVLGGGMSNVTRLYEALPALLDTYVFSDKCVTPIRRATHGDSSGVRGAARLW